MQFGSPIGKLRAQLAVWRRCYVGRDATKRGFSYRGRVGSWIGARPYFLGIPGGRAQDSSPVCLNGPHFITCTRAPKKVKNRLTYGDPVFFTKKGWSILMRIEGEERQIVLSCIYI